MTIAELEGKNRPLSAGWRDAAFLNHLSSPPISNSVFRGSVMNSTIPADLLERLRHEVALITVKTARAVFTVINATSCRRSLNKSDGIADFIKSLREKDI
jgi:hypothetical protein